MIYTARWYKVSLLIPIYSVEQFIERCARSLFGQTYSDLEFVFVNDCTPDRSVEILQKVMEEYDGRRSFVRIINHERNRGLAATRNTALDNATGEFVCLVDSDDWMSPDAIEVLVNKQLENDDDLVSGNRLVHYPEMENVWLERKYQDKEEMTMQMMLHSWDHLITGRLVRNTLFTDNGLRWNEGLDIAEDRFMMSLLAYHAQRFDTVDSVVYHYERRNLNSISRVNDGPSAFRNNNQELGNLMSLRRFFKDKDAECQRKCTLLIMEQLKFNMKTALAFASKTEFDRIVRFIDGFSNNYLSHIGWGKKGVKGWLLHNYCLMRMEWLGIKTMRIAKRKLLNGGFCS